MRRHDYQGKSKVEFGADMDVSGALTDEDVKELYRELKHRHATTQAAITGTIETESHTMEVVCEDWDISHPRFRDTEGRRMFVSSDEEAEGLRLLFKPKYDGTRSFGYKYRIKKVELEIHWHRQPDCPVCGDALTYGMMDWDPLDKHDGFMTGWLCDDCLPRGVAPNEGVR